MSTIRLQIASDPDREKVFVEFWYGEDHIGEVIHEHANMELIIYPRRDDQPWNLDLDLVIESIIKAKKRLMGEIP
jgi:hypothetical protein